MNFSSISSSSVFGQLLRLPLRLIPRAMVIRIIQGPLRGAKWIVGSSSHGCWLGSYEYEKQQLFIRLTGEGNVVFDIGAHVGFYTLLAAKLVGETGRVIAFEPLPTNLTFLHQHMRLNHISNAQIIEAAASDTDGATRFRLGKTKAMGKIADTGELAVQMLRLDTFLMQGHIPAPNIIKIDTEGAELRVLHGAHALLSKYHPIILLATHDPELHRKCCEYLLSLDYQLASLTGQPIEHTDELIARYAHNDGYRQQTKILTVSHIVLLRLVSCLTPGPAWMRLALHPSCPSSCKKAH